MPDHELVSLTSDGDYDCPTNPFDFWTRANLGEIMPDLVSPLTWSAIRDPLNDAFRHIYRAGGLNWVDDICFARTFYGRVYMNMGALHHITSDFFGLPSDFSLRSIGGPVPAHHPALQRRPFRPSLTLRRLPHLLRMAVRQEVAIDRFHRSIPSLDAVAQTYASLDLTRFSNSQLLRSMRSLQVYSQGHSRLLMMANAAAFGSFGLLALLCDIWCGDRTLAEEMVIGLDSTQTGEGALRLWQIARRAAAIPSVRKLIADQAPQHLLPALEQTPEAAPIAAELHSYLNEFGHRCAGEVDISVPRWREDPTPLMAIFRGYVLDSSRADPVQQQRELRARHRQAEARAMRSLAPWQRPFFTLAVYQSRRLMSLRENTKFHLLKLLMQERRATLEIARRLVQKGMLEQPQDVFLLPLPALERALLWRSTPARRQKVLATVHEQREEQARLLSYVAPEVLGPDGQPLTELRPTPAEPTTPTTVINGLGASPGQARGRARVLLSAGEGAALQPGEVLVARITDPGWTPLFPLAAAVVTDLGGILSHGAVVAREMGIPAVVNTREATHLITTGQVIDVDGSRGTVTIVHDQDT